MLFNLDQSEILSSGNGLKLLSNDYNKIIEGEGHRPVRNMVFILELVERVVEKGEKKAGNLYFLLFHNFLKCFLCQSPSPFPKRQTLISSKRKVFADDNFEPLMKMAGSYPKG